MVLRPSELRLTALVGAQPEASAAGVSLTGFRKPLLHGLLGALGLASPGLSLFWEEPRDIMGDPLTRRKSSEAVLLSVPGTVFFNGAAKPGEGKHCPQLDCMWWLEGGVGPQAGLMVPRLTSRHGIPALKAAVSCRRTGRRGASWM